MEMGKEGEERGGGSWGRRRGMKRGRVLSVDGEGAGEGGRKRRRELGGIEGGWGWGRRRKVGEEG